MPKSIDFTGQKFGRLTAINDTGTHDKRSRKLWLWRCDCGKEIVRVSAPIKKGLQVSCGCHRDEQSRARKKHGMWKTRTYRAWVEMKARVDGKDERCREAYTDRGISIDKEWRSNFSAFYRDMGECPPSMELGRIDNDGDYEPGNCQWETRKQQTSNTRRTIWVEVGGVSMCLKDACRNLGLNYHTALSRLGYGYSLQDAVSLRSLVSEAKKGNKNRLGQSPSEETRHKISQKLKGRTISDDVRANMSAGQRRRVAKLAEAAD